MRTINERFTDEEFDQLEERKEDRTWHDAILEEFGVEGRKAVVEDGGEQQ